SYEICKFLCNDGKRIVWLKPLMALCFVAFLFVQLAASYKLRLCFPPRSFGKRDESSGRWRKRAQLRDLARLMPVLHLLERSGQGESAISEARPALLSATLVRIHTP